MIFPSQSLAQGIQQDFSSGSHILLRLRVFHPISSIAVGVFLIFLAGWLRKREENDLWINRFSNALSLLILIQLAFGAVTLLTGAPIVMQLIHLLLADAVWIVFVLLSAAFLAKQNEKNRVSARDLA
jgi:heme A synthase